MNILILDVDSKIPNLALKKVEKYHFDLGDEIMWNNPMFRGWADKIYVSCVFSWNKDKCHEWEDDPKVLMGGSGYNLKMTLSPEIEAVNPKINLGFTSRGCIRKCPFCIVPEKEGHIRAVADIYDIWDGKSKDIILLDNNILALPEHFKMICSQLRKEKLRVDFNQGLDHRLLSKDIIGELKTTSHHEYRFAFDHPRNFNTVRKTIDLLQKNQINRSLWYVLVGFDTTFQEDLDRVNYLRSRNQNAYIQRYNQTKDRKYITLARWVNQHHIFHGMTWEQFKKRLESMGIVRYGADEN